MESKEERLAKGLAYKEEGNKHFQDGEWQKAVASYHYANLYLFGLANDAKGIEGVLSGKAQGPINDGAAALKELPESQRQLSLVRSNMAACFLKLGKYTRAVEVADQSLKTDPSNLKAAYRKLQGLRLSNDLKYKPFLDELLKKYPQEELLRKELRDWTVENKRKVAQADKKMSGFLNRASVNTSAFAASSAGSTARPSQR